jgi:hypothetical protein
MTSTFEFNEFMNRHTPIVGFGSWASPIVDIGEGFIKCTMPTSQEAQHMCQNHVTKNILSLLFYLF